MGGNWLEKLQLNWQNIFSVKRAMIEPAVKAVLQCHQVVFSEGPNFIKDFKAKIRTP